MLGSSSLFFIPEIVHDPVFLQFLQKGIYKDGA